jgi:pSer/pThr/pTyr-binding forkhead associated (FHA) protein
MTHTLLVKDQQGEREVLLADSLEVGRDPRCDISSADPQLSRRHAEFVVSGPHVVVRDLGSRNGVFVNGRRQTEAVLSAGDVVQIARLVVTFRSTMDPRGRAAGEPNEQTAILSARGAGAAAAVLAGPNGSAPDAAERPAAWSVKVDAQGDRTNRLPPPGSYDASGPTLSGSSAPVLPWADAADRLREPPADSTSSGLGRAPTRTVTALPALALAALCFSLGVSAAVLTGGLSFTGRASLIAAGFVAALGAGLVTAWAIRRAASRDGRTRTPAGGQGHLQG